MRTIAVVKQIDTGASAAVNSSDSPFQAGNEVVAHIIISVGGTGGGRGWTVEGNDEAPGDTPIWVALTTEVTDTHTELFTITVPRQIRLNTTTAGSGSKDASLHLIGEM